MTYQNRNRAAWFKPSYDELNTYIITLTCILLVVTHAEMTEWRRGVWSIGRFIEVICMISFAGVASLGALLSIFNVLVKRPKESWEKTAMAGLAMGANGTAGIACGIELMPQGWTLAAVIPAWNIAASVLLLYQMGTVSSEQVISDEDATLRQAAVATGWLLALFVICEWCLKLTWPMTFSVSTAYASFSGRLLRGGPGRA